MPIIKSAKKRMRQNVKRRERNFPVRSKMKSVMKAALALIKEGKADEAAKYMPIAYSVIDTATKKKIIKPNTAARKKSIIARALNELQMKGGAKSTAATEEKVEKKAEPKEEVKAEKKDDAEVEA